MFKNAVSEATDEVAKKINEKWESCFIKKHPYITGAIGGLIIAAVIFQPRLVITLPSKMTGLML